MAVYTQEDMDRKLMRKIIGDFPPGNYVTPELAMQRHFGRVVMLVRWTFLRYCQRKNLTVVWLEEFGHNLMNARIGMWMDEPYMKMRDAGGDDIILAKLSLDTLKELYKYIKGLD